VNSGVRENRECTGDRRVEYYSLTPDGIIGRDALFKDDAADHQKFPRAPRDSKNLKAQTEDLRITRVHQGPPGGEGHKRDSRPRWGRWADLGENRDAPFGGHKK